MKFYGEAAQVHASEPVVVTMDRNWRGKPVSNMAAASAKRLQDRLNRIDSAEVNAAMFTMRGVSAVNENDWTTARKDFLQAYSLDPNSAFSLNNRGYVAEMDGDLETAQFFYGKARQAGDARAPVGLATHRDAEGKSLLSVATTSDRQVDTELDRYSQQRHRETGPIELTPRGNGTSGDSDASPEKQGPAEVAPPAASPQQQ